MLILVELGGAENEVEAFKSEVAVQFGDRGSSPASGGSLLTFR